MYKIYKINKSILSESINKLHFFNGDDDDVRAEVYKNSYHESKTENDFPPWCNQGAGTTNLSQELHLLPWYLSGSIN